MVEARSAWERVSALDGGTVAGLATATAADETSRAFAATSAGVFSSADHGATWTTVSSPVPFTEVVAPSPEFGRDRTLYAGGRDGVHRSIDAGSTWARVLSDAHVMSLAVSTQLVLAGTELDGVLRSEDRGRTWASANPGLQDLTVLALALSPELARDGTGLAATASGLYRTRNAARSWREVDLGGDMAVQCLALSPEFAEDRLALAGSESNGLYRSEDAGATWQPVADLAGRSVSALAFARRSRTIAAATDVGIALSDDGGRAWRITAADLGPVLALAWMLGTGEDEVLVTGLHRAGLARVAPSNGTWTATNAGLHARLLLSLAVSPGFEQDQTLFTAGPEDGVLVSTDAGRTWSGAVEPRADNPSISSIAMHADGRTLLAATAEARLLQSNDLGQSWRGLADPDFGEGEIVSLACAPPAAIFVGTRGAGAGELVLWRSTDTGATWQRWLVEAGGGDVLPIAVSSSYSFDERMLVGVGGRVLQPVPRTRETRRGEQRPMWRGVQVGSADALVTALATPPGAEGARTVFAATSAGVFVSRDGGERFSLLEADRAPSQVVALAAAPGYVYALGLGGVLWRLAMGG